MTPIIYDITEHVYGSTFKGLALDIEIDGSKDLTDVSIICEFRFGPSLTLAKRCSIGSGVTVTDIDNGLAKVDAFKVDFAQGDGTYEYEVLIIKDGDVLPFARGKFPVKYRIAKETAEA